ncbi:MAG: molybdenum cofactor biosynthesis enzyme MoaA, partial [Algoriphagus sp.]
MPEHGIPLSPAKELMTAEEIGKFAEIFVGFGVKKIRLTGGEPLLRKDFADIARLLAAFPVEISITTNGMLLDRNIELLQGLGIKHLNFSLDTLKESRFSEMTRRTGFQKTMENFHLAIEEQFQLKINCVLMKGENDDEIVDFIRLTKDLPISVRFIEFMPFDGNKWNKSKLVSEAEILLQVEEEFGKANLVSLPDEKNLTARKF